jgi:soluble lytic murein transglycosylase
MPFRLIVILSLTAAAAPAVSSIVAPPLIFLNLKLSAPFALEEALKQETLGLDQEDETSRKELLQQARDYADSRRSRTEAAKWLSECFSKGASQANPFCRYEIERQNPLSTLAQSSSSVRLSPRALSKELADGRFEDVTRASWPDMVAATSILYSSGRIDGVVNRVLTNKSCFHPSLPASLAYKLEERFPDQDATSQVDSLYRLAIKSRPCATGSANGSALSAALTVANFRLGLIQVLRNRCDDVPQLMSAVEADREAAPFHSRARYWRFHCASLSQDSETQKAVRETLLRENPMTFHALAAWADTDDPAVRVLGNTPPRVAMRSIVRADLNGMVRATEALIRIGEKNLAAEMIERNVRAVGSMEPEVRLYVATLMHQIGHALPKFRILSELFQDVPRSVSEATLRLYFPLWYMDEVKSSATVVDPLLIISLIRQESAFEKLARSPVGARGLMQVMPQTARNVARVRAKQLFDPSINIDVGTKYFLKRLGQYDGDVELTLAAYNAGFSRVDQWRKRYPTDNKILFLDLIPFRETRDYVSSILRNYYWYVRLYGPPIESSRESRTLASTNSKALAIATAQAGRAAMTEKK